MMFPDSGLVVGPSHSDGGVYASVANGPDVELEGGEFIINKEATEDFLPLIKQINDIGRMEQMNNADNAQNAHSAIDALIASASTKMMPGGGMVEPKTPMYQEGGVLNITGYDPRQEETFTRLQLPSSSGRRGLLGVINNAILKNRLEKQAELLGSSLNPEESSVLPRVSLQTPDGNKGNFGVTVSKPVLKSQFKGSDAEQMEKLSELDNLQNRPEMQNIMQALEKRAQQPNNIFDLLRSLAPEKQQGGMIQYQKGGNVEGIDVKEKNGKFSAQAIISVPASMVGDEGGRRYYLSSPQTSSGRQNAMTKAEMNARRKMAYTPEDSIPAALAEEYFDRQNKKSPLGFLQGLLNREQGGMIQYEEGGPLHSRRMFNQGTGFDKKKSDLNKDGKISEYEKKRGMAIAKSMKNQMQMGGMIGMQQPMMQRPMNPAMNLSPMQRMGNNMPPMMYQEGGKVSQEDVLKMVDSLYSDVENPFTRELLFQTDPDMKDMPGRVNPMRALLEALTTQRATRDGGRFKSMMGRYKLDDSPKPRGIDELLSNINLQSMMQEARPSREGRDQSQVVQDNLARRIGSSSDIQTPNDLVRYLTTARPAFQVSSPEDNDNVENFFKMIENIDAVPKSRKSMQMGGQVQLRKQAEMRKEPKEKMNVIFPFINEMPFLYPNFQGPLSPSQSESLNEFLKQLEEEKEKQPKKLMAQEGGMISDNNLMGAMANDRRVAALQPDVYSSKMENGMTVEQKMMVPKLAEAILPVYGVETPLSKRQSSMLKKNAVSPSALNPNLKGLVNRLLVQRLANETT